jgi:hypothetical protein
MDSFSDILKYLIGLGYKKSDIVDKRYMRHFVAFYYYCKRAK